jgi:hypothetical protein
MFFVFPILDMFRRVSSEGFNISWSTDFLYHGHFDSFQSFARALDVDIITWGYQLLGNILFFVPRSLWPGKPIGSGAFLANETQLEYSNISMNYLAEGYINFGIFGSFIFIAFAGWFLSRLDCRARFGWIGLSGTERVFYLLAIGLVFFVMRGDLLSSISYIFGHLFSIVAINRFTLFFDTRKSERSCLRHA